MGFKNVQHFLNFTLVNAIMSKITFFLHPVDYFNYLKLFFLDN